MKTNKIKTEPQSNNSYISLTECACPRCHITHKSKIFWTGKLPASIFCHSCKAIASMQSSRIYNDAGYNSVALRHGGAE